MYLKSKNRQDLISWAEEFLSIYNKTTDEDENRLYSLEQAGHSLAHEVLSALKKKW